MDYDKKHHSELAYTLYMYLTHERNLAAAAEAMEMHRSSLVYRFKKIYELLGNDFEDYRERMYMILSYEMNRRRWRRAQPPREKKNTAPNIPGAVSIYRRSFRSRHDPWHHREGASPVRCRAGKQPAHCRSLSL